MPELNQKRPEFSYKELEAYKNFLDESDPLLINSPLLQIGSAGSFIPVADDGLRQTEFSIKRLFQAMVFVRKIIITRDYFETIIDFRKPFENFILFFKQL